MRAYADELDWDSFATFLNPCATEPLFPNLRILDCYHAPLAMDTHFPSLISLTVNMDFECEGGRDMFLDSFESFSQLSPHIRTLAVSASQHDVASSNRLSGCVCRWQNLQIVDCGYTTLDLDALAHLFRLPALGELTFQLAPTLLEQMTTFDSSLVFPALHDLTLYSEFLGPISHLFSRIRLPAITALDIFIGHSPSKQDVTFFFSSVQTCGSSHTIQVLQLEQEVPWDEMIVAEDPVPVLGLEDLRSCMAFGNLQRIDLNLKWDVELTDNELLTLASAWPHVEELFINSDWGWNTQGGITPNGLLQLLRICPSLHRIAIAIDTRGYTEHAQSPASLGLTLPPRFFVDILDSVIEEEAVPAIATFFASIRSRPQLSWRPPRVKSPDFKVYWERWNDVSNRFRNAVYRRS